MSRQFPLFGLLASLAVVVATGCRPQQPLFLHEDGDLSHYKGVATEIEFPDVEEESLGEVDGAMRPFSLDNSDPREIWDLTLEEAVHFALENSKVMRSIGGQILGPPDALVRAPEQIVTVYDPAIIETNPRGGIEAALAAFDAQASASMTWAKNDTPRNSPVFAGAQSIFPRTFRQDTGGFQAQISKTAATGGTWTIRHNVNYDLQKDTSRLFISDWNVNLEAEMRQPLLQGAGVQFNRIANPGAIPGFNNGVVIARINTDIALADFEKGVRDLVRDVEIAYWEVYFAYRNLDAVVAGRDSGLRTWREVHTKWTVGAEGGDAHTEAQSRQQYFLFVNAVEQGLNGLYAAESKLRYIMGLAATDGRLIRPADEPTTAKVAFDWNESHAEALCRSVELRKQKWTVKRRELEMISAKNYLLPRLDAIARYRWLGMGDDLINPNNTGNPFDNAYESMTGGNFQEWTAGLEFSMPIGFRKEMAGVRHAQLNLA
ncbi:MAG TPA: TolC family protein, partial [Thermoguttaceae bacterium]|nr:TolC family protein [Thermoguttaceae bacterium]